MEEKTGEGRFGRFGTGRDRSVEKETLQELLATAIDAYVICDFLIGTQNIITKQGILASVGGSYFVLYQPENDSYLLCDIFTLKFITLFQPGKRPS